MFWALFVLGHDCGHGSFSRHAGVNGLVGHVLHSFLLVPYHCWRLSHRKHHKNTGNLDKDEIFYPMRAARLRKKPWRRGLFALLPGLLAAVFKPIMPRQRSGYTRAMVQTTAPPQSCPTNTALSMPLASSRPIRSAQNTSMP